MQVETQTIINYCIISLNELYHRHPEVPDPKPYDESDSSSQHSDEFSSNEEDNDAFDSVVDKQSAAPLEEGKGEPEDGSATAAASKAGKPKTESRAKSKKVRSKASQIKKRKAAQAQLDNLKELPHRIGKKTQQFSPGERTVRSRIGLAPPSHARSLVHGKLHRDDDSDETLAREYVESMTVQDIRKALRERDMKVSGVKAEVVERLLEVLVEERGRRNKKKAKVAHSIVALDMGEDEEAEEAEEDVDMKTLLRSMMQQQKMMLELLHQRDVSDHAQEHAREAAPRITAKKPPHSPPMDVAEPATTRLAKNMADSFQQIKPRASTYMGDHDMMTFFRHNLEMAKLIQENASLRQDNLLKDMVRGVPDE